jgi:hypothetical protein
MSQLSKSLEKRIQELTASIDAQKTELAAYQRVLHLEISKGTAPSETEPVAEEAPSAAPHDESETESAMSSMEVSDVSFKGNKTTLVADIVKTYGSSGATPKEVDAFFTSKNIPRSKNLVYNTLSYLVTRKKLIRRAGKYFAAAGPFPARKKRGPKKAAAKKVVAKAAKRKFSPEGLKRIQDALKKRWADKRAAAAAAGTTKKASKKKA